MKTYYLHIPKTGGQTLATRMATAFPADQVHIFGDELKHPQGVSQLVSLFQINQFVESHSAGPILKDFHDISVVTTVREPVNQIVSNYLHIRREPAHRLWKVANSLPFRKFLNEYGYFLCNQQAQYFVSAFHASPIPIHQSRFLAERIYECLDRIRWAVPTESIDDFVQMWALENKVVVPGNWMNVNVAPKTPDQSEIAALVTSCPELYSVDLLLWTEVKRRYAEYRRNVLLNAIGFHQNDNNSRAFWDGESGVWLRDGWYPRALGRDTQAEWWAGPSQFSEIYYVRSNDRRYLKFNIAVVCGIRRDDVRVLDDSRLVELPMLRKMISEDLMEVWVDIGNMPNEGRVFAFVPEVLSPMIVDAKSEDGERRSFCSTDWQLLS